MSDGITNGDDGVAIRKISFSDCILNRLYNDGWHVKRTQKGLMQQFLLSNELIKSLMSRQQSLAGLIVIDRSGLRCRNEADET